jgi:hypothetical protein
MATATGYIVSQPYGWNTQQMYRIAQKVLDSSKLKFGGFNYSPVITRIPSGYARTGAYIRQYSNDGGSNTHQYYLGLCNFDTLGDRVETVSDYGTGNLFVAVYDTGEFAVSLPGTIEMYALELLDPVSLNPIGFMVWQVGGNSAIFADANTVTQGSVTIIIPEPVRVGNTVKVSRVHFITPLGLAVTRHLYSANVANTHTNMCIQVGSSKFIQLGSYFIDITGEV